MSRTLPRRSAAAAGVLAVAALAFGSLPADAVPSEQAFASFDSGAAGDLQATPFTLEGCEEPTLGTSDLSGSDFVPAGAVDQTTVSCTLESGLTITFDEEVADLDLYLLDLPTRQCATVGYTVTANVDGSLVAADPGTVSIASGFEGATLDGSTLLVDYDDGTSGVLHVDGPVSSLLLTSSREAPVVTLTFGTEYVAPTTTTTAAPTTTSTTAAGPAVAGTGAAVTPAFTC